MLFVTVVSLAGVAASLLIPGWSDFLLLAGPVALASVLLWLAKLRKRARPVIVDGSNVMYWDSNTPRLGTIQQVLDALQARGFAPQVVFDANVGYVLFDRFIDSAGFARLLRLPNGRVHVVPRGAPADETILQIAEQRRLPIVSNDRYRDWAETFAQSTMPGNLITGHYSKGKLHLQIPQA